MNSRRPLGRIGSAVPLALVLALVTASGASAQRTKKSDPRPNLVPASVTNLTKIDPEPGFQDLTIDDNRVAKQRYRMCAANRGLMTAGQPWKMIISFPDDKGGRPNTYYWSPHDVTQALKSNGTYCYERDIWIKTCRATNPKITIAVDTDNVIAESDESADDNRKSFYPTSMLDVDSVCP